MSQEHLKLVTLRLPIFSTNKPYVYIRTAKDSEKYRISLSPEFLNQYKLNFKILRSDNLEKLLNGNHPNLGYFQTGKLSIKLPDINKLKVFKTTVILDTDEEDRDETLKIDKYIFMDESGEEHTAVLIINREYHEEENLCLTFISKRFLKIKDLLDYIQSI